MTTLYPKDFECTRCKAPKRRAEEFVPGLDPEDMPQYPMCADHAEAWRRDLLIELGKLYERIEKWKPTK